LTKKRRSAALPLAAKTTSNKIDFNRNQLVKTTEYRVADLDQWKELMNLQSCVFLFLMVQQIRHDRFVILNVLAQGYRDGFTSRCRSCTGQHKLAPVKRR
jgi:hypothetical protein